MTDKPEPTAEHIDAVARHLPMLVPWDRLTEGSRNDFRRRARKILTDPAAHAAQAANLPTDAMLTALVERGALSEKRKTRCSRVQPTTGPREERQP